MLSVKNGGGGRGVIPDPTALSDSAKFQDKETKLLLSKLGLQAC